MKKYQINFDGTNWNTVNEGRFRHEADAIAYVRRLEGGKEGRIERTSKDRIELHFDAEDASR
jgi:hypothetical protein